MSLPGSGIGSLDFSYLREKAEQHWDWFWFNIPNKIAQLCYSSLNKILHQIHKERETSKAYSRQWIIIKA